ncbi:MAG: DUF2946 family protein [Burkholderiales bacterium]|jgi:hypothetical protein|nr:DUF2946 family protein [Burkholderiales bacterium]MBP7520643.1 DUF2946 family protein [Leptothrix sp. (in: b-proteobacteria)]HQY07369.1 DUF2946 family protein [Burkholderiaceae bacterium]
MATTRRQHRTGWIGIALILLNLCSPLLGQTLSRAGWMPGAGAGLPMEICSAGMPMPIDVDGGSDRTLRPAGEGHCVLCSHASVAAVLPGVEVVVAHTPQSHTTRLRVGHSWVPRSSFPLQVRPQPPPAQIA